MSYHRTERLDMELGHPLFVTSPIIEGATDRAADIAADAAPLRLQMMGQMIAFAHGRAVALPRARKTRAVLAVLALSGSRRMLRSAMTGLLWSRREQEQARASLRQSVHELQAFGAELGLQLLNTERQHLQLRPGLVGSDLIAIAGASPARPAALDQLQGDLLDDLVGLDPAFDVWIVQREREIREAAAGVATQILEAEHAPAAVLAAAGRLIEISPTRELGWRRLIEIHAQSGEHSLAIEACERCLAAFARAGLSGPSDATQALIAGVRDRLPAGGADPAAHGGPGAGPRPSWGGVWLGVAAFRAVDGEDSLSMGLAEEITLALARFRWMNLIAPGSVSEALGGRAQWRELGLDFLLDGSVRRAGDQIRVTVQLLDLRAGGGSMEMTAGAPRGEVVWSARFDREATDLFTLQDEIAAATAAQVDPQLMLRETQRAAVVPVRDATAYDLMLRAIPAIHRLAQPAFGEAGGFLAEASARAPDDAAILGWWACWHVYHVGQGWAADPEAEMRQAGVLAERAVLLDPNCARALSVAAFVRSFLLHEDISTTIGLHERALALNPNLPFAWAVAALTLTYAGEHETAIARGLQAKRLSPFDPHSFFFDSALMVPNLMLGRFETVVALGRRSVALNASMTATWKGLLSALGHLGREVEAAEVLVRLLLLEPGFNLVDAAARSPLRRVEDLHVYVSGLRKAGLK